MATLMVLVGKVAVALEVEMTEGLHFAIQQRPVQGLSQPGVVLRREWEGVLSEARPERWVEREHRL